MCLAASALLLGGCNAIVNRAAFYPDRTFAIPEDQLPSGVKHVFIPSLANGKVEAFIVQGQNQGSAVIYFHGNGGNIAQRVPELQKIADITKATVIGVGYRGYGASPGSTSERSIYEDGESALRYVTNDLGFSTDKIVLFGRSLGSTVAARLAAHHHLSGTILITPLSTGQAFAKVHAPAVLSVLVAGSFDNLAQATALSGPVLIIHGTDDEVIPFSHGQALFTAIKAPKRFVAIERGRHNDLEFVDPKTFWQAVTDFLESPPR